MSYKRLTNNNLEEYDPEYDFCIDCKYFGEPDGCNRPNGTCSNYERFLETYNRLAELEDKIESHKLVELKYRNGDYVFFISWLSGNVCEGTVIDWQEDSGYCIISGNDMISAYECFPTKSEAEKKLEELSKTLDKVK